MHNNCYCNKVIIALLYLYLEEVGGFDKAPYQCITNDFIGLLNYKRRQMNILIVLVKTKTKLLQNGLSHWYLYTP